MVLVNWPGLIGDNDDCKGLVELDSWVLGAYWKTGATGDKKDRK